MENDPIGATRKDRNGFFVAAWREEYHFMMRAKIHGIKGVIRNEEAQGYEMALRPFHV